MSFTKKRKVILIIRDGWGYRESKIDNTIKKADTPIDDALRENYPWTLINASAEAVGLPPGYQGNSEVGHITIGSGRIIDQSLVRINKSIDSGEFFNNKEFLSAIKRAKENNGCLHIMGLLQKEGVHSHMDHLLALIDLCQREKFDRVFHHVVTDGRDAFPTRSLEYLNELVLEIKKVGFGRIATISGRYYAMDRDRRWDRTKKAYDAIVDGISDDKFDDPILFLKSRYSINETDEFIVPTCNKDYKGMSQKDSVIFYNLRTDRPRQLTQAIVEPEFNHWKREAPGVFFVAMTDYYKSMNAEIAFNETDINNTLGEVLEKEGMNQLRVSETEKYAHVTFFFNGQKETPFSNEERILVPSPKDVLTYDKKPEMSAYQVGEEVISGIASSKYDLIVVNLVNVDMVGHTGDRDKTKIAVEVVDQVCGSIVEAGISHQYEIIVTADHGNAEDQSGGKITSHTTNKVPLIFVSDRIVSLRDGGGLRDIAPTILDILRVRKPKEMSGKSLIVKGVYANLKLLYNRVKSLLK
jgi:2,3-bisphosphoglycerate-independent phosphoglycerate mutase